MVGFLARLRNRKSVGPVEKYQFSTAASSTKLEECDTSTIVNRTFSIRPVDFSESEKSVALTTRYHPRSGTITAEVAASLAIPRRSEGEDEKYQGQQHKTKH
jgi:hypothetical protein